MKIYAKNEEKELNLGILKKKSVCLGQNMVQIWRTRDFLVNISHYTVSQAEKI